MSIILLSIPLFTAIYIWLVEKDKKEILNKSLVFTIINLMQT